MHHTPDDSLAFTDHEELLHSGNRVLYRAKRSEDGAAVIIQKSESSDQTQTMHDEAKLLARIATDATLPPLSFTDIKGDAALALRDPGGNFLRSLLPASAMAVADFLDWAIAITQSLEKVHDAGIVHRAIGPDTLFVESRPNRIRLSGFQNATDLPKSSQHLELRHFHDGSLAYMAPEQTGRVNRQVDQRADLYAVGVVFYRLLTGRLPFDGDHPLDVIYGHIACNPQDPTQYNRAAPRVVGDIVVKLLGKNAEERYQSAKGLLTDLMRCRERLHSLGRVEPFPLAEHDAINRLEIPDKLYGRQGAFELLEASFQRVCSGGVELLTVNGYAGIGKTALVRAIQTPVLAAKGYFAAGKFDQLTREEPYSALIQALNDLVSQLVTESDTAIRNWRNRILAALGGNAQVVIDVAPGLRQILGPQPPVTALGPTESRNRLELQFQRLFNVLGAPEHPFVLFLDDLQWADSASLSLIVSLIAHAKPSSVLLLGAYRDNEVPTHHPLRMALKAIEEAGGRLSECVLNPLGLEEISSMLVDTLRRPPEMVHALASLVQEKTLGNPFFARVFLESAFANGLVQLVDGEGWHWDSEKIRRTQPTENVIDLLASNIDSLPAKSREVLELAACVGNRFSAATLVTITETGLNKVHRSLLPPLRQGLIETAPSNDYAFCHDRVQEAAYRRIPDDRRNQLHLHVGTLLLQQGEEHPAGEHLFDITDHLNHALDLVSHQSQRHRFAKLNLDAAIRARRSAAFEAALRYFNYGVQWLSGDCWDMDHDLCFALFIGRAEAAFLCGQAEEAEADTEVLLQQAKTDLGRGEVYALKMVQYENSGRFDRSVEAGKSALALFGIEFPIVREQAERAVDQALADIEQALEGRQTAKLIELPSMKDPQSRMSMSLLMTLWPSAYISGDKTLTVLIAARMVLLSLQHGNAPESAYGYVTHAITLGAVMRDYAAAYEYGRLALEINRRFDDHRSRAKINHMFSCYIGFWCRPIAESFTYSLAAYQTGIESGDYVYAAYGCFHESWHALFSGMNLQRFQKNYMEKLGFLERTGNESFRDAHQLMLQWGKGLQGQTRTRGDLDGISFDETIYLSRYRQAEFFVAFHHIAKLHLLYLFGDYAGAKEMAHKAKAVAMGIRGMIWDAWLCLYDGLALTSWSAEQGPISQRDKARLRDSLELMGQWAKSCPQNFAHQYHLLMAEQARLDQQVAAAIEHYEATISTATESGFIHDQALAKERYAEFWLHRDNKRLARFYLTDAITDYAQWGADGKVQQLIECHASILGDTAKAWVAENPQDKSDPIDSTTIVGATLALTEELDSERVAETLLDLLLRTAGAQRAVLFRIDETQPSPVLDARADAAGTTFHPPERLAWRQRVAEKAVNYVCHTRDSLLIGDAVHDERLATDPYVSEQLVSSIICAPMISQSELQGLVYLENRIVLDAFTRKDLNMAEVLANQAAVALKNARLFRGLQQEIRQREKAEKRLLAVAKGTAAAVGTHFFEELVFHLAQAMQVRIAFVTECHTADRKRVRALAFIDNGRFLPDVEYAVDGTPCTEVIDGNVCFYANGLEEKYPKEKGLASYLGVPMHGSDGAIIGHLAVAHDEPLAVNPDDESLLRIFAIRAAAELERQMAQKAAEKSQRALSERRRLAAIGEFASMIAHEIRSPLSTIQMAFDYLRGTSLADGATKRLELATTESLRLQSLLNEILLFAKPQLLSLSTVNIDSLIRECIFTVERLENRDASGSEYRCRTNQPTIDGDPDKLKQVMINLVTNACQAVAEGQSISVELLEGDAAETVQVEVRNPGYIAEDMLARLTEPFFTTKSQGTGLGLAIVKRIADAHQGLFEVVNETSPQQVCVTVTLPRHAK